MVISEDLDVILNRIAAGNHTVADLQRLRREITASNDQTIVQIGKYAVNIAKGNDIHVGDSFSITFGDRIYQGASAEAIRDIIRTVLEEIQSTPQHPTSKPKSVEELVLEVRSHLTDIEQQRHGTMLLWRVNEPVPVDEIYVDVEILERPTKEFSSDKDGLLQTFQPEDRASFYTMGLGKPSRRLAGIKAVEQSFERNLNLMVLGLPGSGKTTFLQHLLMQCLGGKVPFLG